MRPPTSADQLLTSQSLGRASEAHLNGIKRTGTTIWPTCPRRTSGGTAPRTAIRFEGRTRIAPFFRNSAEPKSRGNRLSHSAMSPLLSTSPTTRPHP